MIDRRFSTNQHTINWQRVLTSPLFLAVIVTLLSILLGMRVARGGQNAFLNLVSYAVAAVLLLVALHRPVWGLAFTLAALPIIDPLVDLLPDLPVLTSLVAGLGAVTLSGFIIRARWDPKANYQIRLRPQYIWAALFIGWAIVTNPGAAVVDGTRNWLWTFIQLFLLLFLASVLLRTPRDHKIVMVSFAIAATLSAIFAVTTSQPEDPSTLGGLAGGANTAARYFLVGFVFWNYLQQEINKPILRLTCQVATIITIIGVAATESRTGLILVFIILLLMVVSCRFNRGSRWFLPLLLITIILLAVLPTQYLELLTSSAYDLQEGTGTVGRRFGLWQAGWRMFMDFPVQGIGIGQFPLQLAQFGADLLPPDKLVLGAHNSFVAVLSETGLVGFILFLATMLSGLVSLWRTHHLDQFPISNLAFTWFLVLLVFFLGGLTKSDQIDKMMWAAVGVGAGMSGYLRSRSENAPEDNQPSTTVTAEY
jgi:O-antigen ligase